MEDIRVLIKGMLTEEQETLLNDIDELFAYLQYDDHTLGLQEAIANTREQENQDAADYVYKVYIDNLNAVLALVGIELTDTQPYSHRDVYEITEAVYQLTDISNLDLVESVLVMDLTSEEIIANLLYQMLGKSPDHWEMHLEDVDQSLIARLIRLTPNAELNEELRKDVSHITDLFKKFTDKRKSALVDRLDMIQALPIDAEEYIRRNGSDLQSQSPVLFAFDLINVAILSGRVSPESIKEYVTQVLDEDFDMATIIALRPHLTTEYARL